MPSLKYDLWMFLHSIMRLLDYCYFADELEPDLVVVDPPLGGPPALPPVSPPILSELELELLVVLVVDEFMV